MSSDMVHELFRLRGDGLSAQTDPSVYTYLYPTSYEVMVPLLPRAGARRSPTTSR